MIKLKYDRDAMRDAISFAMMALPTPEQAEAVPQVTSLFCSVERGLIRVLGTNGKHFARYTVSASWEGEPKAFAIPRTGLDRFLRPIDGGGRVQLSLAGDLATPSAVQSNAIEHFTWPAGGSYVALSLVALRGSPISNKLGEGGQVLRACRIPGIREPESINEGDFPLVEAVADGTSTIYSAFAPQVLYFQRGPRSLAICRYVLDPKAVSNIPGKPVGEEAISSKN